MTLAEIQKPTSAPEPERTPERLPRAPENDASAAVSIEQRDADVVIARLRGEIDYLAAPAVRRQLTELVDQALRAIVVDLSEVELLSAAAMEMLLALDVLAGVGDTEVRIVAADRRVRRPLSLTGLDERLRLYATLEEALGPPSGTG